MSQITITFSDKSCKKYDANIRAIDIAKDISTTLGKKAMLAKVNGELYDLNRAIENDATLELLTKESDEFLEVLRHDSAHIMAAAVQKLFPGTQVTIGPVIENGFFYDFYNEDYKFTPDDLLKIEKKMMQIVDQNHETVRQVWQRDQAIEYFKSIGEHFKAEIIESIPADQTITVYRQGDFLDLCRGPHLTSTGKIGKAFKLLSIAGAYWRGNSNNPQLQRIYGTAWATKEQLAQHLYRLEEAEKRDHRKLGLQMQLFHQQKEAAGCVFWHAKGWKLFRNIQQYIREQLAENNYIEVNTPLLMDKTLWQQSGHWDKFRENMFTFNISKNEQPAEQSSEQSTANPDGEKQHNNDDDNGGSAIGLKPMNCPGHIQIFNQSIRSYKDLPIRMSEFGSCSRNESSGSLHGLMRVRVMTQDDAHIFCTPEQITEETTKFCTLLRNIYADFGFHDFEVRFSDRPQVRAGDDETWDMTETALTAGAKAANLDYTLNKGDGAFYGPKLEFVLSDALNRKWQCGTLQLDCVLPQRLKANYIGKDNEKHQAVMLHRAVLGSLERFIAVLIEHHAGHLPLWLAPLKVKVCPITSDLNDYAKDIATKLNKLNIDSETDLRNEKINYKVREHSVNKIPLIIIVGNKEQQENSVSFRILGSTKNYQESFDLFIKKIENNITHKHSLKDWINSYEN